MNRGWTRGFGPPTVENKYFMPYLLMERGQVRICVSIMSMHSEIKYERSILEWTAGFVLFINHINVSRVYMSN